MKYFIYFLMVFAVAMMILSASLIDFSDVFGEESKFGSIGFMASLIILVLLFILLVSKRIKQRNDEVL